MKLESLYLRNFRSYEKACFEFSDGVNVICGINGTGKTNMLEAVYMLSGSRSWRTVKNADLIMWDKEGAFIGAKAQSRGRDFNIEITMPAKGKSNVLINDVKITKKSDMSRVLRCVIFSPEDLFLIKGAASRRRNLLDNCLCQLSSKYCDDLSRYEKILLSKQKILKDGLDLSVLPEYNYQLAFYGAALAAARNQLCLKLQDYAKTCHASISNGKENLSLCYKTVSVIDFGMTEEQIFKALFSHFNDLKNAETAAQSCLSGVHKDDISVFINGKDAKSFASQGQSRTAAIALKFAERELLREDGDYPLLLLDDVLSELDSARQNFIIGNALGGQVLISCCVLPENIKANLIEI